MTSRITLVTLAVLSFMASGMVDQAEAGFLPNILCNSLKNRFLRLGCLDTPTVRCNTLYTRITFTLLGIPACDFVACNGYGNALGTCTASSECDRSNSGAICNTGQVCCQVLRTTTTTTTTTTASPGGGGGGSSDDKSLAASDDSNGNNDFEQLFRVFGQRNSRQRAAMDNGGGSSSNESK